MNSLNVSTMRLASDEVMPHFAASCSTRACCVIFMFLFVSVPRVGTLIDSRNVLALDYFARVFFRVASRGHSFGFLEGNAGRELGAVDCTVFLSSDLGQFIE